MVVVDVRGVEVVVVVVCPGANVVVVVVVPSCLGHFPLSSPFRLIACFRSRCAFLTSAVALPVAVPLNKRLGLEK